MLIKSIHLFDAHVFDVKHHKQNHTIAIGIHWMGLPYGPRTKSECAQSRLLQLRIKER